jgi:hypothetical protein
MKRMAIEVIDCQPNKYKPTPGHKIYPYFLRKLQIDRPNQIWATDITPSRWRAASPISPPWPTGSGAGFCPGGSRSLSLDGVVLYRGAGGNARETRHAGHLQYPNG